MKQARQGELCERGINDASSRPRVPSPFSSTTGSKTTIAPRPICSS